MYYPYVTAPFVAHALAVAEAGGGLPLVELLAREGRLKWEYPSLGHLREDHGVVNAAVVCGYGETVDD